ncbi:hypothetical protein [Capnocytophaga sp.]|uniref:hypothetical protein n=1 Tax=Capnocytophaga sp. TaxID=44737 RepID=UPI0026DC5AA7|nr:hypothetical protein [Capnocytophaga sp.]MDO5105627.1 hypothetical protein [Capnocytophaga sp.]
MNYSYYYIQSDENFSKKIERTQLVDFLQSVKELQQKDHQTFQNSTDFQWFDMILTETKDGNFASSDTPIGWVRLIAVVCDENANQNAYIQLFRKIADHFGWQLYKENDDRENELI